MKPEDRTLLEQLQALSATNERLTQEARVDSLTLLYNRRHFDECIESECRRAERLQHYLSLIIIDIDHFKRVDDHFGHQAGDACLSALADTLDRTVKRPGDVAFRYGDDAFAILLPHTSPQGAAILAESIRLAVGAAGIRPQGHVLDLTVSLGVGGWIPRSGMHADGLIRHAESALATAKELGRNRVCMARTCNDPQYMHENRQDEYAQPQPRPATVAGLTPYKCAS